ncbi:5-oxoprolinase subunit PxpB [uncultured Pseudoalteromonas sp.]|uniref:5-oxoprolinase subunit PxpB n=1 Tax=uncultured Pseudoalteromonas sp. TaxID=114053 RepID=UPI0030C8C0F3
MTELLQVVALTNTSLFLNASHHKQSDALETQKKIWALTAQLEKNDEFSDLVPGMNSLTLYLKSATHLEKWQTTLPQLWEKVRASTFEGTHHQIPTRYEGEDLDFVAKKTNLTPKQIIEIHSQATYHVLFLGFQPGFAYLHGLDPRLHISRRETPRTKVPKGAIALGSDQTAIYPAQTPGGWHIIGHTNTSLFDSTHPEPCLFKPGDTLSFIPSNTVQGA